MNRICGGGKTGVPLMPAEAGIQCVVKNWIPAFARMSGRDYAFTTAGSR